MKIVFFGTSDYVVPILEALHNEYNRGRERQLIAVVTQPPKPVGREKKIEHSPVDNWAFKHKLPIATDINEAPIATLGVLASYGQIIPQEVIDRYELGILNIHPSELPEFRGASPIQATILAGKEKATVSVMKMDHLMDHGPIISTFKEDILPDDTSDTLRDRLFSRSAEFILDLIPAYASGKIKPKAQKHEEASFTKLIKKEDGFIPPQYIAAAIVGKELDETWAIRFMPNYELPITSVGIDRFIRAMSPWPNAWTTVKLQNSEVTKRLKILKAHLHPSASTNHSSLVLDQVQMEGKNPVSWKEFINGYPDFKFG